MGANRIRVEACAWSSSSSPWVCRCAGPPLWFLGAVRLLISPGGPFALDEVLTFSAAFPFACVFPAATLAYDTPPGGLIPLVGLSSGDEIFTSAAFSPGQSSRVKTMVPLQMRQKVLTFPLASCP